MKEYLAFDVGGTSVKYALCNEEGEVSSASKFKTPDTLDQMYLEIEKVVNNNPNVEGIALSMPGAVDSDGGIIYGSSAINYIHGPNIKEDLQNRFHKPVELENDANCAALAEVWKGVAKDENDCCFIAGYWRQILFYTIIYRVEGSDNDINTDKLFYNYCRNEILK